MNQLLAMRAKSNLGRRGQLVMSDLQLEAAQSLDVDLNITLSSQDGVLCFIDWDIKNESSH